MAGQTAADSSAGVREQTEQVLGKIDDLLAAAGTDKSRLLTATVYLSDIRHFDDMNAVWESWLPPLYPSRWAHAPALRERR